MRHAHTLPSDDVQQRAPSITVGLSRAGVSRSRKALSVVVDGMTRVLPASIECFADLAGAQKGVHMSRFEEIVNEAIEVGAQTAAPLDVIAQSIAEKIVAAQAAHRGEVRITAEHHVTRRTPVTDLPSHEVYEVHGIAAASAHASRRIIGASAQGMNACPCAQELIQAQAAEALAGKGYAAEDVSQIVDVVPIATHNQRARGTLLVGTQDDIAVDPETLIGIIEDGMSSEIYELMKRPDEQWVVAKAHRRPRFVEDSVREMLRGVVEELPGLADTAFISAHQLNFETIHAHDVEALREGLLGPVRAEMTGGETPAGPGPTRSAWLAAAAD